MSELLTTKQFAEKVGLTQKRINQLITDGVIEAQKFSHLILISDSEIEKAKNREIKKAGRPRTKPVTETKK